MHPTLTHVPPIGSPLLIISADFPRSFALLAAANAAAPPPMITRSWLPILSLLLLETNPLTNFDLRPRSPAR